MSATNRTKTFRVGQRNCCISKGDFLTITELCSHIHFSPFSENQNESAIHWHCIGVEEEIMYLKTLYIPSKVKKCWSWQINFPSTYQSISGRYYFVYLISPKKELTGIYMTGEMRTAQREFHQSHEELCGPRLKCILSLQCIVVRGGSCQWAVISALPMMDFSRYDCRTAVKMRIKKPLSVIRRGWRWNLTFTIDVL